VINAKVATKGVTDGVMPRVPVLAYYLWYCHCICMNDMRASMIN